MAPKELVGLVSIASQMEGKLRVFISYSRDDLKFADQLDAALSACGFECLIDRHGISGGEAWKPRLGNLISEADTVVFVLTASNSNVCLRHSSVYPSAPSLLPRTRA